MDYPPHDRIGSHSPIHSLVDHANKEGGDGIPEDADVIPEEEEGEV